MTQRTDKHKAVHTVTDRDVADSVRPSNSLVFHRTLGRSMVGVAAAAAVIAIAIPAMAAGTTAKSAVPGVSVAAANATEATRHVTLAAREATWTSIRHPSSPQTAQPYLSATRTADASFLKFDTRSLDGKTVAGAALQLRVASTTATSAGVQVYPTTSSWSKSTLTHKTLPAHVSALASTSSVAAVTGKTIMIPLATTKSLWSNTTTSFEVRYSQAAKSTTFYRSGVYGPQLKLVLSDGTTATPSPSPTTTMAPPTTTTPPATNRATPSQGGELAFNVAKANSSSKKVFAHYFPPYPVSLDNQPSASDYYARNYLTPNGEGGIHAVSGGFLRDRPEGRAPIAGDWKLADMISEVNAAADRGIDGFNVDILSLSGNNWDRTVLLMKAAQLSGRNFTIVPNLDATASAGKADINTIAAKLAELYKYPSAYKLGTGEYVLSSFAAERQRPAWWTQLKDTLSNKYGVKTAFIAILLSPSDANLKAFAPISYAIGDWGTRTAQTITNAPGYAAKVHKLGTKWMAPVAVQDERPRSFLYAEANNTETLRASWDRAQADSADLVQLVTWNDYSEGTSFAPSAGHGEAFLDINAYYATRFKTGTAPTVTGDAIYVTNRIQAASAVPATTQHLMAPTLSGTTTKPRDAVEVLTFLVRSATVTVKIGSTTATYAAPAGVSTKTFPVTVGGITVSAVRGDTQVAKVVSTHPIVAKPLVQDLSYYANSSREQ